MLVQEPLNSEMIQSATKEAARWRKRRRPILIVTLILWVSFMGISGLASKGLPFPIPVMVGLVAAWVSFVCYMAFVYKPKRTSPIHQLWDTADHSIIGAVIDAYHMMLPEMSKQAGVTLLTLLPQLTPDDEQYLNEYHRKCLRKFVSPITANAIVQMAGDTKSEMNIEHSHTQLAAATIKAWKSVGNRDDLAIVESLASGNVISNRSHVVLDAAIACLPTLRARVEAMKPQETYLRASSAPVELLRPAYGAEETDPALLLRPSRPDD